MFTELTFRANYQANDRSIPAERILQDNDILF